MGLYKDNYKTFAISILQTWKILESSHLVNLMSFTTCHITSWDGTKVFCPVHKRPSLAHLNFKA